MRLYIYQSFSTVPTHTNKMGIKICVLRVVLKDGFLQCVEDNLPTQLMRETTGEHALLDLLFKNRETAVITKW